MSFIAFIIGMGLPAIAGWMLLRLLEGNTPILTKMERGAAGVILGTTIAMWCVFVLHATIGLPLNRLGFLGTEIGLLAIIAAVYFWRRPLGNVTVKPEKDASHVQMILWILIGVAVIKVALAAMTFLLLTPTYLDDTLDNWNLRGRVFFEDQTLTLALPGEDPVLSPKGVSSYPPTVPLLKASLAAIAGEWNDPLVNSVHVVWFAAAALLVYGTVRRRLSKTWALLGMYIYISMPLVTMHGTNTYADVFVSIHVFLAAAWLLEALQESNQSRRRSIVLLLGLALAALTFTKNEGIVLYLPPLLLIFALGLWVHWNRRTIDLREGIRLILRAALPLLLLVIPWLLFKWTQGLTFGNAKPFSSLSIYWRDNVLLSVFINTFLEGNWLLLFPLFFTLLAWRIRAAWKTYLPLTAFIAIVYFGQLMIFLFTDLAAEALMQTGYARGLVQLLPCIAFLTTVLLADASETWSKALALKRH